MARPSLKASAAPRRAHSRTRLILALTAMILALGATTVGALHVAVLSWINPAGGTASTSSNWSPAQAPTSADDLTFNINNTYTVTYDAGAAASRSHTYKRGTVTLNVPSPHAIGSGITVGDVAGDVATTRLTTGNVTSSGIIVVGDAAGSTGTLIVDDDDADLLTATSAGDVIVGNSGTGNLDLTGGGRLQVADRFQAGSGTSSVADIVISGQLLSAPFTRSTLDVLGSTLAHAIGAGGDATMEVLAGGRAEFAGSLNVAQGSQSSSSLSVSGIGLGPSTVAVAGDLGIARNSAAGTPGGFGVVSVASPGILTVGGTTNVGNDPDGGTGFLVLDDGGTIATGSLAVGAAGELDLDGGELTVDGGAFTYANPTVALSISGVDDPLVNLDNGATATLQAGPSGRALTIAGGTGANLGDLVVLAGSDLSATSGDIVVGEHSDDAGRLEVQGIGSSLTLAASEQLVVGQNGDALFAARSQATVAAGDLFIARNPSANATALIESSSNLTSRNIYVGGAAQTAGGAGILHVNAGGTCTASGADGGFVRVWPTGTLEVTNGTLFADTVTVAGTAIIDQGTVHATAFNVDNVDVVASGAIDARVRIRSGLSSITASPGNLTLGNGGDDAFYNVGLLDCGGSAVTILCNNTAFLGNVRLDGGSLTVPSGRLFAGDSLSGTGTVDGDLEHHGTIAAEADGLRLKGIVSGVGMGLGGTRLDFVEGGGFRGAGAIDAELFCDPASSIVATGDLTLGDGGNDGVMIQGSLDAGNHFVTLADGSVAQLFGHSVLEGGQIHVATGQLALGDGTLEGFGTVSARTSLVGGTIVATGPLLVGESGRPDGFFGHSGQLLVGQHTVTLLDADAAELPTLTSIEGGTLSCATGFFLDVPGKTLRGGGTCEGDVQSAGVVQPGGATGIGTLVVVGDLTTTGKVAVEIGNGEGARASGADGGAGVAESGAADVDLIDVTGNAVLSGTLQVGALTGFELTAGQRFVILRCGSRSGVFTSVEFDDPVLAQLLEVEYSPDTVELVATATTDLPPGGPIDDPMGTEPSVPLDFALRLAGPNPSRGGEDIAIEYDVPAGGSAVSLAVYDATGRLVARLVEGVHPGGRYPVEWRAADAGDLPSGVYLLRMDARSFHEARRLVLLR